MKKPGLPPLIPVLILIFMLFLGILIFTYVEAKKANPRMIEVNATLVQLPAHQS